MNSPEQRHPIAVFRSVAVHLGNDLTRSGDLYVYPGEVGVRLKKWVLPREDDGRLIHQIGGRVQLNVARFPPWFNTVIFIDNERHQCCAGMPGWHRQRLRTALATAGLQIKFVRRTVFNLYVR
jgi:hypothetical protein